MRLGTRGGGAGGASVVVALVFVVVVARAQAVRVIRSGLRGQEPLRRNLVNRGAPTVVPPAMLRASVRSPRSTSKTVRASSVARKATRSSFAKKRSETTTTEIKINRQIYL